MIGPVASYVCASLTFAPLTFAPGWFLWSTCLLDSQFPVRQIQNNCWLYPCTRLCPRFPASGTRK